MKEQTAVLKIYQFAELRWGTTPRRSAFESSRSPTLVREA